MKLWRYLRTRIVRFSYNNSAYNYAVLCYCAVTCWDNCDIINVWVWENPSAPLCMKPYCVMGPCNKQDIPAACSWEMKTAALAVSTVGTSGIRSAHISPIHFTCLPILIVLVNHALFPALLACVCALLSFFSIACRFVMIFTIKYTLQKTNWLF